MKTFAVVAVVTALVLAVGAPAYAFNCPNLIR